MVSASNNTITKSGHGLSNDEYVLYSSGDGNDPIGGLVSETIIMCLERL